MSFITPKQVQKLQIARSRVAKLSNGVFDDEQYQMTLLNCGVQAGPDGRCSSKNLTHAGFEKFMAIMEGMGFRDGENDQKWRDGNARRTGLATSRQVHEIRRLAKEPGQKYPLSSLCLRVSNNTHNQPDKLTFKQAYSLIEALKEISIRQEKSA